MKAMLSQPMAGKTDEEIVSTREKAISALKENGYEVINTLFTDDWYSKEKMTERGVVQIPLCFLAKSLENMSLCDAAYFCKGWENARGCRIEHEVACAYGLTVIYEEGYNRLNPPMWAEGAMEILVKRHTDIPLPEKVPIGDWVDLRAAEDVDLKAGESKLISLGLSMKLPDGYGAILAPRSSTFKRTGMLQANSIGVFENSFCGDEDIWGFFAYATRDVHINKGDRICQFMIYKLQPELTFKEVDHMPDRSRGGWGSTGVN